MQTNAWKRTLQKRARASSSQRQKQVHQSLQQLPTMEGRGGGGRDSTSFRWKPDKALPYHGLPSSQHKKWSFLLSLLERFSALWSVFLFCIGAMTWSLLRDCCSTYAQAGVPIVQECKGTMAGAVLLCISAEGKKIWLGFSSGFTSAQV